jgi:hypothetical protein
MAALPAILLLLARTASAHPASLVGIYQIETMEVGGGLQLKKNGHFRFALSYGALDEEGEGNWTSDGKTVVLTSSPMPKEPTFVLVKDSPAAGCTLSISVDWSKMDWASPPDVLVTYDGAPKELHFLQAEDDGTLHPAKCVTTVMPIVPMFDIAGEALNLSPATGHALSLRFEPNDLGHVAFDGQPLAVTARGLVLNRYDREIRFVRVRP